MRGGSEGGGSVCVEGGAALHLRPGTGQSDQHQHSVQLLCLFAAASATVAASAAASACGLCVICLMPLMKWLLWK